MLMISVIFWSEFNFLMVSSTVFSIMFIFFIMFSCFVFSVLLVLASMTIILVRISFIFLSVLFSFCVIQSIFVFVSLVSCLNIYLICSLVLSLLKGFSSSLWVLNIVFNL